MCISYFCPGRDRNSLEPRIFAFVHVQNIIVIAGHNGEFALGQNPLAKVMTCPGFQVGGVPIR